jgi:hypothetical protein
VSFVLKALGTLGAQLGLVVSCSCYIRSTVTSPKAYPKLALALLTALNLLNYIDRSVLFAVQDLLKAEFHRSDTAFGVLSER